LREQFTYIRDTVMRRLTYPDHARRMGWSGKVLLSFIVFEDGTVHSVKTLRGSGFPLLDSGAVEAVLRAAPFPRPPLRVEVILPVSYRLL
jgi:protein TonB